MQLTALTRARTRGAAAPPFAAWPVLCVAGVVAIAHLVASIGGEYWLDEVYMLATGRNHLEWGYVDQPPVVPLLAAAMDWIAPDSTLVLRLPAVAATAAAVVVAALIAREIGGDRRAQVLTAGAQATALWITFTGHWLTPYTIEPLTWLLLIWLLVRWIRLREDRLLLILGVVAGIATQTKFQVFLLCAVLLLCVLASGPRELLRRPMFWGGFGVALLIASPTLIWQALHGWPQLRLGEIVASESAFVSGGRSGTAVLLIVLAGVAGTVLLIYGLWRLLSSTELRDYRFLGIAFLVLYVFVVATAGRHYYLDGFYGIGVAAGALGLQRRREAYRQEGRKVRWSWFAWPAYVLSVAAAGGMLTLGFAMSNPPGLPVGEAIAKRTAEAYRQLPAETRKHTAIVGESYILASYLDVYGPEYRIPSAYSPHRGYGYFPPPDERSEHVLFVGSPDRLRPHFAEVRKLADGGSDGSVWLCTAKQDSWAQLWPRLMSL